MRGTGSLRRYPERRSATSAKLQTEEANYRLQEITAKRALWDLRFYCWRSFLRLGLATLLVVDAGVAVVTGGQPRSVALVVELIAAGS